VESVGYGGRIWSHYDTESIPGFIIQAILILVAPALFAASIYMLLGRIISLVDGEVHSLLRLKWLTKVFVVGDILSFTLQAGGGGIQAGGTLDFLRLGERIIVGGLFVQIFFFSYFVISALWFHTRISAQPTALSIREETPWQKHIILLYATSTIILVRSVFRVVEYLMGNDGWVLRHEFMLYIFDTILMFAVVAIFILKHPGTLFIDAPTNTNPSAHPGADVEMIESKEGFSPALPY
jgi:hypothetical protein